MPSARLASGGFRRFPISGLTLSSHAGELFTQGWLIFEGGTGKLKGLENEGTYKDRPDPNDPSLIFQVEGQYEFAKK